MIELQLIGVRVQLPANAPIVLLKEKDGERYLPIWIGTSEAEAILKGMQGLVAPRPFTHDLLRDLLQTLGASVQRILITELRESTFYAEIELSQNGSKLSVSSRPSDAIALACRVGVPIYANEDVMSEAALPIRGIEDDEEQEVEKFREFLEQVNPEDFR